MREGDGVTFKTRTLEEMGFVKREIPLSLPTQETAQPAAQVGPEAVASAPVKAGENAEETTVEKSGSVQPAAADSGAVKQR